MTNVRQLLEIYHFSILKHMASLLDVPVASASKAAHVRALAPVLLTPDAIKKGLAQLGEREMAALTAIQRADGRIEANRLRLQLLRQRVIEPDPRTTTYYTSYRSDPLLPETHRTHFQSVIGRLMAAGVVCGEGIVEESYSTRTRIYYDNVQTLYIPEPVESVLPEAPPAEIRTMPLESLAHVHEGSARAFQRDLYFYWSTVRANPLSLTQQERLYRRDLRLVNDALLQPLELGSRDEPDVPRLLFLRLLLTDLGLLKVDSSRSEQPTQVRASELPPFFGEGPLQRIRQTFTHWRDGTFWNEMLSVPGITIVNSVSRLEPAPKQVVDARKRVLQHIAELHKATVQRRSAQGSAQQGKEERALVPLADEWTPIAELLDELRSLDYDFLLPRDHRPSRSTYYAYYGYTQSRSPYISYGNEMGWSFSPGFQDEAEGWEVVEAGFIRAILIEPLYWMGLVDVGYGRGVGEALLPIAYRLTAVGAQVLGVGPQVNIPQGEGRVVVQPNFEIFALDPISDMALANLDQFADRISGERAIKYQLSRESVYRAQRNGWTVTQILESLRRMSAQTEEGASGASPALPQNVVRALQEWQQLHERITIRPHATLLQAIDEATMEEVTGDPSVRRYLANRPGEKVAIVDPEPGKTDALIRTLQKAGYPPTRTRSPADAARPSLTAGEDGQLHFATPLPSIYLFEQIAPFTGQDEQERYFVTQSAVQRAVEQGLNVQEILSRLQTLHVGPLPQQLAVKIRAWGHYYGDVAMETVTLIQIQDQETLQELLAEPGVKEILQPFAPSKDKALALVAKGDAARLHEFLAERAIHVKGGLK